MPRHNDDEQKVMQNEPAKVEAFLDKMRTFLEGQSASLDGGWPVVTEDDMTAANDLVSDMIRLKFGEDCDRDVPVEFRLVDRTRFESMGYWPLEYEHRTKTEDELLSIMDTAEMNLNIAHDRFQTLWRILGHMRSERKKDEKEDSE